MCTNPRGATSATAAPLPAPAEDDDDDDEPEVVAPPTRKRKHSQQWTCGACTFVNEGGRTCDVCGASKSYDAKRPPAALRELAAHNAVPSPRPPPPTGGDDTPEGDDDAAMAEAPPEAEDAAEERPLPVDDAEDAEERPPPPDDDDAEMAEDASDAAAAADDGGVAGLLRSMMVAEQTSRQESGAVVAVAACRDTVAVATARSISLLRLEGAADVRELRRCASPGGSVVAVAVERRGDFLAVACNSRGDDRLLAVYDFSQSEAPKLRARPQGNQRRSKTRLHLDVDGNEWSARWCESYNDDRPVAHRWDSADEWVELPFPDDITLVRDMTRGEGSKRKWTCAVCSGSETCVILWDESGSRSFVLPVEPRAYVFVPSGASCRVGRWAAAHASDAAEGYGSLVCVAHAATADGITAVACAVRSDLKAAKAASGAARRSSIEQVPPARRVAAGGPFLCEAGSGASFRVHDVVGEQSSHLEGEGEADVGACARLCVVDRGAAGACIVSTHAGADREVRFLPLAAPAGGGGS